MIGIGQDGIGPEFSTKTDTGIVEPLGTYELQLNYNASRPRSPQSQKNKLQLKLEVNRLKIILIKMKTNDSYLDLRCRWNAWWSKICEYSCVC